jgi:hypothetical protein
MAKDKKVVVVDLTGSAPKLLVPDGADYAPGEAAKVARMNGLFDLAKLLDACADAKLAAAAA